MRRELKYAELVPFFKICGQVFDEEVFNELKKCWDENNGKASVLFTVLSATGKEKLISCRIKDL